MDKNFKRKARIKEKILIKRLEVKRFLLLSVLALASLLFLTGCGGGGGVGPSGPQVSIISPPNGATVSGIVKIEVSTTSDLGIAKVEFYVDDQLKGTATSSPYTCDWNADEFAYGTKHSIYAKAYDSAGHSGTSPQITVTIGDSQAPQISIISPQSPSVLVSSIVPIRASVQDRGGKSRAPSGIQKLEFFVDDVKLGEVPGNSQISGTFECPTPWNTDGLRAGTTHTIRVRATDNLGQFSDATLQVSLYAEWTILIYADAHNNLGQALLNHLADLQSSLPSTKGVNILILAGFATGDSIVWLHNGVFSTSTFPNFLNFGDPSTLSNFILSCVQGFPAKKYLIHLWDHGSGWRKRMEKEGARDICFDEYFNNDGLTSPELKQALQAVVNQLGRKIDLLLLNACLMGTIEVDYELKDLVNYCVSSEHIFLDAPLWGEAYNKLVSNPTMSPADLGITIADTYYKQAQGQQFATIAVKDYSKIDNIASDIYYFAHYLRDCLPNGADAIMDLRNKTTSFSPYSDVPSYYYIDLYQFANLIANNTTYDLLKTAAQNLMNDIKASNIYCKFFGVPSAQGYSIFFPTPTDILLDPGADDKYLSLDFAQADCGKEWRQFLSQELQSLGKGMRGNWVKNVIMENH